MKSYYFEKAIKIPIYKGRLVFIITNCSKTLFEKTTYDINPIYAHSVFGNYKGFEGYVMVLNFDANSYITHGVLAHEAFHLANLIAKERGFISNFNNDEPIAYIVNWIVDEVYPFVEKHGFKVHIK